MARACVDFERAEPMVRGHLGEVVVGVIRCTVHGVDLWQQF